MKIYTRHGDTGQTSLFDGSQVPKTDPRIETYGTVDELNSFLGVAATACRGTVLEPVLTNLQHDLFALGADLATPAGAPNAAKIRRMDAADAARLEVVIDKFEAELTPLRQFILPGGSPAAAHLHVARAVCRRAERCLCALLASGGASLETLVYLNRLSDLLFVLARKANAIENVPDKPWSPAVRR